MKKFLIPVLSVFLSIAFTPAFAAINKPPTANSQSMSTNEDTPMAIILTGSDPENATLTYFIVSNPSRGSLSGSGNEWTYTPSANKNGTDTFRFKVYDGSLYSSAAIVTITVNAVNDKPTATGASYTYNEDYTATIRPTTSDVDGDARTVQVVSQPSLGKATASGSVITFTPNANVNGQTSFTFVANDGKVNSDPATISITINPVNDPPTVVNTNLITDEDIPLVMTVDNLGAIDIDGDSITFVVSYSSHDGTVTGSGTSTLIYTPRENFYGTDTITYLAMDKNGAYSSDTATVDITINWVSDASDTTGEVVDDCFVCDDDAHLYCSGLYSADWESWAIQNEYPIASWKYSMLDCLQDPDHDVSQACQDAIDRRQAINDNVDTLCSNDRADFCEGIEPQPGTETPEISCLLEHYDELDPDCAQALDDHENNKCSENAL